MKNYNKNNIILSIKCDICLTNLQYIYILLIMILDFS